MSELWRRTAGELAALIRTGEVSSREVVQAHLDRIEDVNPVVNAVTVTLVESALTAADAADAASNDDRGPLHGVPAREHQALGDARLADHERHPCARGVPARA